MQRLILSLLVSATLALAGCYTNPVTGRTSLVLLSQGEELTLGAKSFAEISQKEKVSKDSRLNARVNRIGQRIAQAVGNELPGAKWEFVVFESPDLNASRSPAARSAFIPGYCNSPRATRNSRPSWATRSAT